MYQNVVDGAPPGPWPPCAQALNGVATNFVLAVSTLNAHSTTHADRARVNEWLIRFQGSSECWEVTKQLLQDPAAPEEVQVFVAQMMKGAAKRLSVSVPASDCQQMQRDIIAILASQQRPCPRTQPVVKQLCLALVAISLPCAEVLGQLIAHMTACMPAACALLTLEYLAEEVTGMMHLERAGFTSEQKLHAAAELKAQISEHAGTALSWLACQANEQQQQQQQQPAEGQALLQRHAAAVISCFGAWAGLGALHASSPLQQADMEVLVVLALTHLGQPSSEAFEAAAHALSEVVDRCPESWFGVLHDHMVTLADVAVEAAEAGYVFSAERISRVVSPFCAARVVCAGIADSLGSAVPFQYDAQALLLLGRLARLAVLPQLGDGGEPACWPAVQAWVTVADAIFAFSVAIEDKSNEVAGPLEVVGFQTAADLASRHHTDTAQALIPDQFRSHTDQMLINILHNLVAWQLPCEGCQGETLMSGVTPLFHSVISDYLRTACDVIGPDRYMSLLYSMMMAGQAGEVENAAGIARSERVMAVAMLSVSSAGGLRLCSSPGSAMQALVAGMAKAAAVAAAAAMRWRQCCLAAGSGPGATAAAVAAAAGAAVEPPITLLGEFCCAVATTGRAVIKHMLTGGQAQEAGQFIMASVEVSVLGLSLPDCHRDTYESPAALAAKAVMQGAREAGAAVPLNCIAVLVEALRSSRAPAAPLAEASLLAALLAALCSQNVADGTRRRLELEVLEQLLQPLRKLLAAQPANQNCLQQQQQQVDEQQLRWHLRCLELLLQQGLQEQGGRSSSDESDSQPTQRPACISRDAFNMLADVLLTELWPRLATLVSQPANASHSNGSAPPPASASSRPAAVESGAFLLPLCSSLAILVRAVPERCSACMPGILEALLSCMFRRTGGHVIYKVIAAALETYSEQLCQKLLLQQLVQHMLSEPQVVRLGVPGAADEQPDLAECVAKICSTYSQNMLSPSVMASFHATVLTSTISAIARLAAGCSCSNHRGAAMSALSATSDLLAAATAAAVAAISASSDQATCQGAAGPGGEAQQQAEIIAQTILQCGGVICAGVIGSLISTSPLSRLHKAGSILAQLSALATAIQVLGQGASPHEWPQQQQQHMIVTWLQEAALGLNVPEEDRDAILNQWPICMLESACGPEIPARQRGLPSRSLKKKLRDFADRHARA